MGNPNGPALISVRHPRDEPSWRDYEYPMTPEDLERVLEAGGIRNWALHTVMQHNARMRRDVKEARTLVVWNAVLVGMAGVVLGLLLG